MHVAKTGLNAQQVRMQIISNNLANVNTNGFKRDRANFESLLYQVIRSSGAQTSVDTELTSGFSVGTGVNIVNSNKLHSQGSIVSTDNALDLAIDGGGFFQVLLPDGQIVYTRNGAFARNNEGTLTTNSGFILQPEIVIPAEATKINVSNHILTITLNRPQKKNALNNVMMNEINYALAYAKQERAIRVVIIAAEGDVFCAGADLNRKQEESNVPRLEGSDDISLSIRPVSYTHLTLPTKRIV